MKTLQKDLNQLRKDHEALLGIQAETTEEQDNLRAELQRVQRNRTPRPNWAKCSGANRTRQPFAEGGSIFKHCAVLHFLPAALHFPWVFQWQAASMVLAGHPTLP